MTLQELFASVDTLMIAGDLQREVLSVTEDSRQVKPGTVFVAIQGEHHDGHQYVRQAHRQGAVGVVVEKEGYDTFAPPKNQLLPASIRVKNSRKTLGLLASRLCGMPSTHLQMVGVTGTNGKTTVTHLAKALLEVQGHHVGLMGTVGYLFGTERRTASHTTPASGELQAMLKAMVKAGMDIAVMEVSSHALALDRVAGCEFDIVVFTNLTQDHLDFHRTLDDYFQAKLKLFTEYVDDRQKKGHKRALINADDQWASVVLQHCSIPVWTFGLYAQADIKAEAIRLSMGGTEFVVNSPFGRMTINSQLVGEHNVSNMLAAIGIGLEMGMTIPMIERAVQAVINVPGRFERIDEGQAFTVVVDYAHTEDALYRLLQAAQAIKQGRIITVFGCGGDRDAGKRPKMGRVAARQSDLLIVTSDNPRTENPQAILAQIEQGIQSVLPEERCPYQIIPDRAEAIHAAVAEAKAGDLVLIAGKGHEDYQIIGTRKIHFDDREEARKALQQRMLGA